MKKNVMRIFLLFSALFEFSLEILWIAVFCRNNTIFFHKFGFISHSSMSQKYRDHEQQVHHYLYFVWRFGNMSMTSVWRRNKKLGKAIASLCQAATLRKPCFWIEVNNFRKGIIYHYTEIFLFKSLLLLTNKTKSLLCK